MATYQTEQRGQLIAFLPRNPGRRFSAQQSAENLSAPKISLRAIYRTLTVLERTGLSTVSQKRAQGKFTISISSQSSAAGAYI